MTASRTALTTARSTSPRARWIAGTLGAMALATGGLVAATQGPANAASPPEVFAGFDNVDQLGGTSPRTNTVTVPAGSYAITAKAYVTSTSATPVDVACRLQAGGNVDDSRVTVAGSSASLALNVVHTTSSSRNIVLTCNNVTSASTTMSFIKIVATRVNAVSDVSM